MTASLPPDWLLPFTGPYPVSVAAARLQNGSRAPRAPERPDLPDSRAVSISLPASFLRPSPTRLRIGRRKSRPSKAPPAIGHGRLSFREACPRPPPAPGGIFHSGGGWGEGGGEEGEEGGGGREGGGGLAGASGEAGVPGLRPEEARLGRQRGRDALAGGLALSVVTAPSRARPAWPQVPWMRPPRAPRPVSIPAVAPGWPPVAAPLSPRVPAPGTVRLRSALPRQSGRAAAPALGPGWADRGRGRRARAERPCSPRRA